MFNNLNDIFKNVYDLAYQRRIDHDKYALKEFSTTKRGLQEYENYQKSNNKKIVDKSESQLEKYMSSLDFETIKIIQTIMYLGKDEEYNKNDTPQQIYTKERSNFDHQGWNKDKNVEINQMVEKVPFDQYLLNGFKILNIRI